MGYSLGFSINGRRKNNSACIIKEAFTKRPSARRILFKLNTKESLTQVSTTTLSENMPSYYKRTYSKYQEIKLLYLRKLNRCLCIINRTWHPLRYIDALTQLFYRKNSLLFFVRNLAHLFTQVYDFGGISILTLYRYCLQYDAYNSDDGSVADFDINEVADDDDLQWE